MYYLLQIQTNEEIMFTEKDDHRALREARKYLWEHGITKEDGSKVKHEVTVTLSGLLRRIKTW
ncbi:MAG: hypothetical protein Q8R39_00550 [bacterium]|nr:hypothetical protein [bacterium]